MKRKKKPSRKELQAFNRDLKQFNQLISQTRKQIKEAHKKGPEFERELEAQLEASEAALAIVRKKLTTAKAHCKKRKYEIDEWKLWYNGLALSDKSAELNQLNDEISWRAEDITKKEIEISQLYIDLVKAEGVSEAIKIQIEGLKVMKWDAPIDEDIRIKNLLKERDKLEAKISKK